MQSTNLLHHIMHSHLWPVWLYHIFEHHLISGVIFGNNYWISKACFDLPYNFGLKHSSFYKEFIHILQIYVSPQVKFPDFLKIV